MWQHWRSVSYAKKDKALSRQHPCSRDDLFQVCLGKPCPRKQAKVDVSVFFGGRSSNMQDSSKASPRTIFKGKSLKEQPKLLLK